MGLPRTLFDIQDRAWLSYTRTYLQYLIEHLDSVASELSIDPEEDPKTRDALSKCFEKRSVSIVADVTDKPFLPERSLDFVMSNCVLSHIPPAELSKMGG